MGDFQLVYKALGRFLTGIVLVAFVSIIAATTISDAEWVQPFCKTMYWIIVGSAIGSGIFWIIQKSFPEMFKDNVESQTQDTIGSEVLNQSKSDAKVDNE